MGWALHVPQGAPPVARPGGSWNPPVTLRQEALEVLRRVGAASDDAIDLAGAALALAVLDHPVPDLAPYRAHLDQLAQDLVTEAGTGPLGLADQVAALRAVLVDRHGYDGDSETYEDLQNANLIRVIDRRRGLPVALGILMLHMARAAGFAMQGLSFPGHFLVRLDAADGRAILDPFAGVAVRAPHDLRELLKQTAGLEAELAPDHYAPVSRREILIRLQNNLKLRHLSTNHADQAVAVVENMLLFAPDHPALWRESGLLNAHLGNLGAAIAAFEQFITIGSRIGASAQLLQQTAQVIQQLRSRLN